MDKVIVILGATAVGKTSMSIKLAKLYNGEIINGDAMQVYKNLNIITDKIKKEDMQGIKHHLFDIIDISDNYSVEQYQENIRKVIKEVAGRNKLPIIVGGTGLYIKSALYDYSFSKDNISNQEIEDKYKDKSNDELYELLRQVDAKSCETIHKNNRRRVLRALAIYHATGKSKSEIINMQKHELLYDALLIGLTLNKDIINKKIDDRIEEMFNNGIIDEVKNNQTTSTASKAIGYKEINDYLNNKITLDEAKKLMKIHTHQYAKRQRTFFNNQFSINWVNNDENALENITTLINNKWDL